MALPILPIMAIIALAALAGGRKKKDAPKAGEKLGGQKSETPDLPSVDDDRPWEKDDKKPPPHTGDTEHYEQVMGRLHAKHLPPGAKPPENFGDNDVWISDDCKAWAIGGNFLPSHIDDVQTTYVKIITDLLALEDPGITTLVGMSHPSEWDARTLTEFGGVAKPNPGMVWVLRNLPEGCRALIPDPGNYPGWMAYNAAWDDFAETRPALAEFVTILADFADKEMGEIWWDGGWADEIDFEWDDIPVTAGEEYDNRQMLRDTLQDLPDAEDGDVANEAYHRLVDFGNGCPEVIDPQNPNHQYCKFLWLHLRDLAGFYRQG